MTRATHTAHSHMQDPESHVRAVAADLEYFRRKRLEPRLSLYARRDIVPWLVLAAAVAEVERPSPDPPPADLEKRVRRLEDSLDELILDIAVSASPVRSADVAIDDVRVERGDYDETFRFAEREYGGTLDEQMALLEEAIADASWLVRAFTRALVVHGELSEETLASRREQLSALGHHNGARVVARAWTDPEFKERLLSTGREAVRELDIPPGKLGKLAVAENTPDVHHVVVCTLCSCYPHDLLGNPPWWYRADEYKERIIDDPRGMLADAFGFQLPEDQVVKVHDSTSDVRWMVLPQRPEGTEGLSEDELADLVTAESLVGVAPAVPPSGGAPVIVRL